MVSHSVMGTIYSGKHSASMPCPFIIKTCDFVDFEVGYTDVILVDWDKATQIPRNVIGRPRWWTCFVGKLFCHAQLSPDTFVVMDSAVPMISWGWFGCSWLFEGKGHYGDSLQWPHKWISYKSGMSPHKPCKSRTPFAMTEQRREASYVIAYSFCPESWLISL